MLLSITNRADWRSMKSRCPGWPTMSIITVSIFEIVNEIKRKLAGKVKRHRWANLIHQARVLSSIAVRWGCERWHIVGCVELIVIPLHFGIVVWRKLV